MKRQLLAGRFGPDDHVDVPVGVDEQRTYLQLVAGEKSLDHGIGGALTSLKKIGVFPSEIGVDLLTRLRLRPTSGRGAAGTLAWV